MMTSYKLVPIFALFALGLPQAAMAQSCGGTPGPDKVKLAVEATNLRSANGQVAFTVYPNDRKRFLAKGAKLARIRVKATQPVTRGCFWLPAGVYAIAQYHDENGDEDFNRVLLTPKEGFGFSNDAPTKIGLPSLASARFTLPQSGTTVRMTMRYRR